MAVLNLDQFIVVVGELKGGGIGDSGVGFAGLVVFPVNVLLGP